MITCTLKYVIDPWKLDAFEDYAKAWIPVVNRMGGSHHGYFLPHEGASDVAYALFSFPSLAAYEDYRKRLATDPECQAILAEEKRVRSILRYERSFLRPVFG